MNRLLPCLALVASLFAFSGPERAKACGGPYGVQPSVDAATSEAIEETVRSHFSANRASVRLLSVTVEREQGGLRRAPEGQRLAYVYFSRRGQVFSQTLFVVPLEAGWRVRGGSTPRAEARRA